MNNKKLAELILEQIGGKENVISVYHCMTRLRFSLKDDNIVSIEQLKAIEGVKGAQFKEDQLQVIIGTAVDDVYQEIVRIGDFGETENREEDTGKHADDTVKKFSIKELGVNIINTFSNCIGPLVPLFVALGMVNIITSLVGPGILNIGGNNGLYQNLHGIGQAILYVLPVLVAVTASHHFGTNLFISIALAGLMIYPELGGALQSEKGFAICGISAPAVMYGGQFVPMIFVVWIQKYVEKLLNKMIPDALKVIGVGTLTILVMFPLEFLILGPAGNAVSKAFIAVTVNLYNFAGPLATMFLCAAIPFMTASGIGRPIFFACVSVLFMEGAEFMYMPISMVLNNFLIMGVALGYWVKESAPAGKKRGRECFISLLAGGVSEPALFEIMLPNKKTYPPIIIAGAVSGLYLGFMKVGYFQFGPSNVLSVLGFISPDGGTNFIHGSIAAGIAFILAFVLTVIMYKRETEEHQ